MLGLLFYVLSLSVYIYNQIAMLVGWCDSVWIIDNLSNELSLSTTLSHIDFPLATRPRALQPTKGVN